MGFIDNMRQKMELRRLEQKYLQRQKRCTYVSNARYVDGEYIYTGSPTSLKSSDSYGSNWSEKRKSTPATKVRDVFKRQSMLI